MSADSAVTAVIPTHNRERLIGRAVASALSQQGAAVEVVVVDDGSTDATGAVLEGIEDPRLRWVRHTQPQGVASARNRGLAEADTPWVAFLDDDDLWSPTKLSGQLAACGDTGCGWSYTGAVAVDDELAIVAAGSPPSAGEVAARLPFRNLVPAGSSSVLARRSLLESEGAFDPSLRHMADWDMWIRLGRTGPPAVVDFPHVAYLLHAGNASLDIAGISRELEVLDERYRALRHGAGVDRAFVYRWVAWSSLRAGKRRSALRAYLQAARHGDLRSLGRALAGVTYPGISRRGLRRHGKGTPSAGLAEQWLGTVRKGLQGSGR